MTLETRGDTPTVPEVPGFPQQQLSDAERNRLERSLARIEGAETVLDERRREFAALVRELGISACARALGITPQALSERIKTIERGKP